LPDADDINAGDNHYLAPETLLGLRRAGYSADMWAVGCMVATFLGMGEPLFNSIARNNATAQIESIAKVRLRAVTVCHFHWERLSAVALPAGIEIDTVL
jgi:serine/threonine protein kinase